MNLLGLEKLALANMFGRKESEPNHGFRNVGLALGGIGGGAIGGVGGAFAHDSLLQTLLKANPRYLDMAVRHPGTLNTVRDMSRLFGRQSVAQLATASPQDAAIVRLLSRIARVGGTPGRMAALGAAGLGLGGATMLGGAGSLVDRLRS